MNRKYFTMTDCSITVGALATAGVSDSNLREYISTKFADNYIFYLDDLEDGSTEETTAKNAAKTKWLNKVKMTFVLTKDKYLKLLELYDAKKNALLEDLGSESEAWFNDTPQNAGSFATESYTTTYNRSKNKVYGQDVIVRLNTIGELYKNLYKDWLDEFKHLFGDEVE